jgi:hypothetical protein
LEDDDEDNQLLRTCLNLDLSNGFNSAFNITEEAFGEFMREMGPEFNPDDDGDLERCKVIPVMFDGLLGLGSEPLEVQFDGLLENIGHLSASAQSKGFKHFKEYATKLCIYYAASDSERICQYLKYFEKKGCALN